MPLDASNVQIVWAPQLGPQHALVDCPFAEILFGGARGGGKTDGVLGKWAIKAQRYGSLFNGVFFRKEMPQADDLVERAKEIYLPLGGEWREQPRQFRMPGGGRIRFRPLENVTDAAKYQGQNLSDCAVEEAGNYEDPKPIDMLFGALRSKGGVPVQLILTANPGGVGQQWIKHRYIDPAPRGMVPLTRKLANGAEHRYIYIPSRLQNNTILLRNDPGYINRLHLVGSPELVRAWLEGDWDVIAGAFFPEWSSDLHVVAPRSLPAYWQRFRSFDWGSARPFSVGWWAVSDGELPEFPRGALIRYREWYGAPKDANGRTIPNTGLRMTAEEVADGIIEREKNDITPNSKRTMGGVADPSIFAEDGGPSIADRMAARKCFWRPADNTRVSQRGAMGGWDQVRARLKGDGERPALFVFSTCLDLIRTLPAMQHDDDRPEDIDCWVAGTMVATPDGPKAIETLEPCDLVDTPLGSRPVLRSYISGRSETIRVSFSDGRVLEGTPHHKIMIQGIGLVALAALKCHMIPQGRIIWPRSLNIAVSCIAAMQGASTTIRMALSWGAEALAYTAKYGWTMGAKFPLAGISTTRTMTTTTMNFRTSNAFPPAITADIISTNAYRVILADGSRLGVARMPDVQRFGRMLERWSSARLNGNARALIVRLLLLHRILTRGFAQMPALMLFRTLLAKFAGSRFGANLIRHGRSEPAHIVAVGRSAERTPVYNLTVADAHLFYANGILSSNTDGEDHCSDEVRYACLSRPYIAPLPAEATRPEPDGYRRKWTSSKRRAGSAMAA